MVVSTVCIFEFETVNLSLLMSIRYTFDNKFTLTSKTYTHEYTPTHDSFHS